MRRLRVAFVLFCIFTLLLCTTLTLFSHIPLQKDLPTAPEQDYLPTQLSRKQGLYTFLCLGRDRASLCTDVILLCAWDTSQNTLHCIQLPRDTYFRTNGTTHLNAVFAQSILAGEAEKTALRQTADQLAAALCVPIDYTALLYLDSFVSLVDRIGGVPINVPFDMIYQDDAQGLFVGLRKGEQVLSGAQAEQFVRFRKSNAGGASYSMGDLGRLQAQKLFLSALFTRLQSLPKKDLLALIPTVLQSFTADCSLADATFFARHATELTPDRVTLATLPGWVDGNAYVLSRPDTYALFSALFFDGQVTEDQFDAQRLFCGDSASMRRRYESPAPKDQSVTLDRLQNEGLSDTDLYLQKRKKS